MVSQHPDHQHYHSPYAKIFAVMAWLWLLTALPFVTDTACQVHIAGVLAITWIILAITWVSGPVVAARSLFPSFSERIWWCSAGLAGYLGVLLALTNIGLIVRLALSQPALSAYVATVPPGTENRSHPNRLVGLFLVDGTEEENGAVMLYTSACFLDRYGIAHVPDGANPPSHRSLRHLFGPWYIIRWHF